MPHDITEEDIDKYLDNFFASRPDPGSYQYREVGAVYCALTSRQFLEEIVMPDAELYQLYLDAEAYMLRMKST